MRDPQCFSLFGTFSYRSAISGGSTPLSPHSSRVAALPPNLRLASNEGVLASSSTGPAGLFSGPELESSDVGWAGPELKATRSLRSQHIILHLQNSTGSFVSRNHLQRPGGFGPTSLGTEQCCSTYFFVFPPLSSPILTRRRFPTVISPSLEILFNYLEIQKYRFLSEIMEPVGFHLR